jgi:hypothetical protein
MKYRQPSRARRWSVASLSLLSTAVMAIGPASAEPRFGSRNDKICSLTSAGVGQPGSVTCLDVATGSVSQSVPVGVTVSTAGGIAGSLVRRGAHVLATNQARGATLFDISAGRLDNATMLDTGGENSLSGTLSERGAYVLTGTRLLFFPRGATTAASSQVLVKADGSAAQVTLAGNYAYVSEKSGSLEAFPVGHDGNLVGGAMAVAGVPAGVIVGITGADDLVVAPIAHLASNANQSTIPVVRGLEVVQIVPTKEMAACWAGNDDGEACITNPGSMTVSCGRLGRDAFKSYTSAAASLLGETVFDVAMADDLVGILGMKSGAPVLLTFSRSRRDGDFLTAGSQFPLGTIAATGVVLIPGRE